MPAKIMCLMNLRPLATGWNMFVISSISPPRWEAAVASQSAKHFFNGNAEWLLNRYVAAIVERHNARKRARRSRWIELSHRKMVLAKSSDPTRDCRDQTPHFAFSQRASRTL